MVFHYHRPLSGMYGDNYRYGTSLYSPTANDVEKNYRTSLSKTHVRSDRGDLGMYTFAGSNVHGGTPAAEKVTGPKGIRSSGGNLYAPLSTTEYGPRYYDHLRAASPPPRARSKASDLYEPINPAEYHPGYYDHLRASSPERRVRSRPIPYYDLPETDYMTNPVKIGGDYSSPTSKTSYDYSYDYDTNAGKKTTVKKTTTTTDYYVPLTTYIYNTPYHTYYYKATPFSSYTYRTADDLYSYQYLDDWKRYSTTTTTTKSKNIDALDLSISKNYEKTEYSKYTEKCHEIKTQLDEVNKWVKEAETKLKSDVVTCRSKLQSELQEVTAFLEDTARYSDDLHKAIRKQAKQISALNNKYDDVNRHLNDITDILEKSRSRCETLQSDLSSVQSVLEIRTKVI